MQLRLKSENGTLDLSKYFKMQISPFKRRLGVKSRYGKDGGVSMGDRLADPRQITLSYYARPDVASITRAEKDLSYRDFLNTITGFFNPEYGPFYLQDLTSEIQTQIEMSENADTPNSEGLEYILGSNILKFEMLSGFWEDIDETTVTQTAFFESGDTIAINNDSLFTAYPVFTLDAVNNCSEFSITNTTTGESMTLGNTSFVAGTTFIIDSRDGLITLEGVENSVSLADGSGFVSLSPGSNSIIFESSVAGQAFLSISFRRRFAH
jgi:hypothetical protein